MASSSSSAAPKKKKKKNRKVDAGSERSLSQIESKGSNVDSNMMGEPPPSPVHNPNERNRASDNSETRSRKMVNRGPVNRRTGSNLGQDDSRKHPGSAGDEKDDHDEAVTAALTMHGENGTSPVLAPLGQLGIRVMPVDPQLPGPDSGTGSLRMSSEGDGGMPWEWELSSCPVCYEEMDFTDLSFLPCPCGLQICLFCHKRIIEGDGRCPGCRSKYDMSL